MITIKTSIKTVKMFLRQLERTFYIQNNSLAYFCFYSAITGCISMIFRFLQRLKKGAEVFAFCKSVQTNYS